MRNRKDKIEYLLREIGEIDDRLLDEAITYKPSRARKYRLELIAACLALVFFLAIALPLMRNMLDLSDGEKDVPDVATLDNVLSEGLGYATNMTSFEGLAYFGTPRLVWQDSDSGEIFVCYLTNGELARLEKEMGKGKDCGAQSPEVACKVWVLDGKGTVRSPYLKNSSGNEGCVVFEYDAEIIPTEGFVECVSEILS